MTINVWEYLAPKKKLEITVWRDNDDEEGVLFKTQILYTTKDSFCVCPDSAIFNDLKKVLSFGMIVGVAMGTEKGPVIFYPTFKALQVDDPKGFWFATPPNMQAELLFRREFIRVEFKRPMTIAYQSGKDQWQTVAARGIDLSGGGTRFLCNKLFAKNTPIIVQMQLNPNIPEIRVEGKIVFIGERNTSESSDEPGKPIVGMRNVYGCQFFNISDQHQTMIIGECNKIQLYKKRDSLIV